MLPQELLEWRDSIPPRGGGYAECRQDFWPQHRRSEDQRRQKLPTRVHAVHGVAVHVRVFMQAERVFQVSKERVEAVEAAA